MGFCKSAHESVFAINKFLFSPKFWSNLTFYIAKGFSRIPLYFNFDFNPSAFDRRMKLNGLQN